jgi:hypothetical protein
VTRSAPRHLFDFVDLPSIDGLPARHAGRHPNPLRGSSNERYCTFSRGCKGRRTYGNPACFPVSSLSETPGVSTVGAAHRAPQRPAGIAVFQLRGTASRRAPAPPRGGRGRRPGRREEIVAKAEFLASGVPPRDAMLHWSCRFFGAGVSSSAFTANCRRGLCRNLRCRIQRGIAEPTLGRRRVSAGRFRRFTAHRDR